MELQATALKGIVRSSDEGLLDAVRTLNSLVAALSVHDDDHYSAFDSALEGGNVQ